MGKRSRARGRHCSLMPGETFTSASAAHDMRITRQSNVALGGMVKVDYVVKMCRCGRYHLMTVKSFNWWDAQRRERKRDA